MKEPILPHPPGIAKLPIEVPGTRRGRTRWTGKDSAQLCQLNFQLEPEEIRRIRKKLHLSQEQAGVLIGGGPRAFQKYESGDLLPSRAVSTALVLLDHDPAALSVLKAHRKAA